ncbi:HNH endonuclease [Gaetbulibacter aestuarii]|uniref:HNH endonuclease n=1 Tax=Gaetbulibacter aestuarii TaxID=1502358 RepID=A0ABW7N204_9FLAO
MKRKCIWCLKDESAETFEKKAHTIPKSLGGDNYYKNICDSCNSYFGNRDSTLTTYSIEEALKEAFNISRKRLLVPERTKRKVGRFKSKFFEIKEKKGRLSLNVKTSFRFTQGFQSQLCRNFKRGLYKMVYEELHRQNKIDEYLNYNIIREFARYNKGELPVIYFFRSFGAIMLMEEEPAKTILYFERMTYLFSSEKFIEIEFLGHVFGFPITNFSEEDFKTYLNQSIALKKGHFKSFVLIKKLTDIDITLSILN